MEKTYSDRYAPLGEDPRVEAYFNSLPSYIQVQIRSRKQKPATYEEMVRAAEEARQAF
ncbi:MAG: hypothetical protein VB096_02075 [Pseudoflavonifractor sp.]|nr:hypothetical protein [Pseudoflavonifractor sp.]